MKNLKLNALAFTLIRILNIAFPLITGPYIARTLNKESLGHFDSVNTIIQIFLPLATFGIYNFGVRGISKIKNDKNKINKLFSELFFVALISTVITTTLYITYFININTSKQILCIYIILGIQLISQFLSIEWLNEAFENYNFILYKTLFIRIFMLILLFTFVNDSGDILPYTTIMACTEALNIAISFFWIKREVKFVKIKIINIIKTFKILIPIFLLSNVNMLYTYLDRLFISKANSSTFIADYTMAQNVVMIIIGVLTGALSVNIPRLSYYLGNNNLKEYQSTLEKGSILSMFLIIPICFGLIILGPYAVLIYGGEQFISAGSATSVFAIRSIFYTLDIILGTHILFINGYEKKITLFVFIGGLINLSLNTLLFINDIFLPEYYIATTAFSEFLVFIFYAKFIIKHRIANIDKILKNTIKYIVASSSFIIIFYLIKNINNIQTILNLQLIYNIMLIIIGCILSYTIILFVSRDYALLYTIKTIYNFYNNTKRKIFRG